MTTVTTEDKDNLSDAISAAMRALSEQQDIELADVHSDKIGKDLRGDADRHAFWRRYHDGAAYRQFCPMVPDAKEAFTFLEAARCEVLGADKMRGVQNNMLSSIADEFSGDLTETQRLYLSLWNTLADRDAGDVGYKHQDVVTRHAAVLRQMLSDPAAYAQHSLELLRDLGFDVADPNLPNADQDGEDMDGSEQGDDSGEGKSEDGDSAMDEEALRKMMAMASAGQTDANAKDLQSMMKNPMSMMGDMEDGETSSPEDHQDAEMPQYARQFATEMGDHSYHVYTTEFDRVEYADRMASREELMELRSYLEDSMSSTQKMIGQFAAKLQRYILARQKHAWQYSYDSGLLDHKRLSQVVINPENPLCYKQTHDAPFRDTVVTLLIDNSGSMRGRPIMTAAVSTEILARTLERCGIRTEILGFTTQHWKGGESQKKWKMSGGGKAPGRLNDLLHIVYKSADMPWRKAKLSLSLMLQEGLLKENIDGEALLWAYDRLRMMPEERKILIVISDGAPIDDATISSNHGQFLEGHLHQVIHWLENKKQIELLSIGIGHDVTRYYKKAVKITDVNDLAATLVDKMIELLA